MTALSNYFQIIEGTKKAGFLLCKDLKEKAESAREILKSCHLCERRCHVNRLEGKQGFCGVLEARVASEFVHVGEEPELVPSYTIFFSGCTFHCVYCQNWDISQYPFRGEYIKPEILAGMISNIRAKNVNWVGGEPTPNLPYVLDVLTHLKTNIPQIWNSNMYLTEESMDLLNGVIDVYLTDFKYGNDKCARNLSDAKNYWEITTRNHLIAREQAEMIIRHLVLPNHLECCTKPILEWISENLENVKVNLMDQYRPEWRAMDFREISRKLTHTEFQEALRFADELGIDLIER